jgi:hypothetical protein
LPGRPRIAHHDLRRILRSMPWSSGVINHPACKICGAPAPEAFRIPKSKKTGHPIPDLPDDCAYYLCSACGFCFSTLLDGADHTKLYDESYWTDQDPD